MTGQSQTGETLLRLRNVSLTLTSRAGPVEVLRAIDFDVLAGQSVAIVGPSGSGKTSLLMVTAGLERASQGSVVVRGRALENLDEDELAVFRGQHIGIVFQSFHLVPTMTALENVALPLELAGDARAFDDARKRLDDVGLSQRAGHFPAELSGGEQQRAAIARALIRRPPLILADEPTGNLDGKTGRLIVDLLKDLKTQSGATLVLVTHDEKLALEMDRVVRMEDGRIVADEMVSA